MAIEIDTAGNPEHWKVDGWRIALEQAATCADVVALEQDLSRRISWAAKKHIAMPDAPLLLRLCDERWHELASKWGVTGRGRREQSPQHDDKGTP